MSLRLAVSLAMLLAASPLPAQAPAAPGSSAAAQAGAVEGLFRSWLEAFNSGDRARIKAFYKQHADDPEPMLALDLAEDSCGLILDRIAARSPTAMTVFLRQKCLPGLQRLKIELASSGGTKTKVLDLRPMPLPGDEAIRATAEIARRLATRDLFAGSLVIRRGNGNVMQRSWGLADPARGTRMSGDTPMFLASAGKMFTAVALLQLVDAGKVELDAPIGRYLTDYPNAEMAKVTIRQLLTHRGGTGDIGILERGDTANRAKVRTVADLIRLNGGRAPAFPPGSKDDYSNYGFVLLGAVIERVTGAAYHDHVRRAVFEPAGMTPQRLSGPRPSRRSRDRLHDLFRGGAEPSPQPGDIAVAGDAGGRRGLDPDGHARLLRGDEGGAAAVAGELPAGDRSGRHLLVRHGLHRQHRRGGELGPWRDVLWNGHRRPPLFEDRYDLPVHGRPRHGLQSPDLRLVSEDLRARGLRQKKAGSRRDAEARRAKGRSPRFAPFLFVILAHAGIHGAVERSWTVEGKVEAGSPPPRG